MHQEDSHLSDQCLLLDLDGELSSRDHKLVQAHLDVCWKCRARRQELEGAITDFVRVHQEELKANLPPAAGPRALLRARLAQLSALEPERRSALYHGSRLTWVVGVSGLIAGLVALGLLFTASRIERRSQSRRQPGFVWIPDSRLTPGATVLVSRLAVCAQENTRNKAVPVAVQRKVFEEYGISGADPRAYEVDYLVTPALGGADDIHNLWPHSYSAVWNAHVKDALEDRLREMVCDGSLDLTEAQQEIAEDWIAAYKKYFHTDKPLPEHCGQCIQ